MTAANIGKKEKKEDTSINMFLKRFLVSPESFTFIIIKRCSNKIKIFSLVVVTSLLVYCTTYYVPSYFKICSIFTLLLYYYFSLLSSLKIFIL